MINFIWKSQVSCDWFYLIQNVHVMYYCSRDVSGSPTSKWHLIYAIHFPDDGIDVRIHSIKIKSGSEEKHLGLSFDNFSQDNFVRYPKLENFEPSVLYQRALLLHRWDLFLVFCQVETQVEKLLASCPDCGLEMA